MIQSDQTFSLDNSCAASSFQAVPSGRADALVAIVDGSVTIALLRGVVGGGPWTEKVHSTTGIALKVVYFS